MLHLHSISLRNTPCIHLPEMVHLSQSKLRKRAFKKTNHSAVCISTFHKHQDNFPNKRQNRGHKMEDTRKTSLNLLPWPALKNRKSGRSFPAWALFNVIPHLHLLQQTSPSPFGETRYPSRTFTPPAEGSPFSLSMLPSRRNHQPPASLLGDDQCYSIKPQSQSWHPSINLSIIRCQTPRFPLSFVSIVFEPRGDRKRLLLSLGSKGSHILGRTQPTHTAFHQSPSKSKPLTFFFPQWE